MGQRMGGQKGVGFKQDDQGSQGRLRSKVSLSRCLFAKSSPPVLLPLPTDPHKPLPQGDLFEETQKNRKPEDLKAPIIKRRSQGMDRPTVRAAILLEQ